MPHIGQPVTRTTAGDIPHLFTRIECGSASVGFYAPVKLAVVDVEARVHAPVTHDTSFVYALPGGAQRLGPKC